MNKGLVHIYTGDGKGKTTAAVGLAVRAAGHNFQVYFLQFMKGMITGEKEISKLSQINFRRANQSEKFYYQMNNNEKKKVQEEIKRIWDKVIDLSRDSIYNIIILDELMSVINNELLSVNKVIELIKNKDYQKELIMTGRKAPEKIIKYADYVTEMKSIKHPYQQGITARKGIEF
ncbi:MAG: cob(I)yrinic acid a,c-diamide adenosyltransferase [Halothermotrichaceae bacterium]